MSYWQHVQPAPFYRLLLCVLDCYESYTWMPEPNQQVMSSVLCRIENGCFFLEGNENRRNTFGPVDFTLNLKNHMLFSPKLFYIYWLIMRVLSCSSFGFWSLLVFCELYVFAHGNINQDDDWIDLDDMINYDPTTKSMKLPTKVSFI